MKSIRRILAITGSLLLALSMAAVPAEADTYNKAVFTENDMNVSNVYVNDTKTDAENVLGKELLDNRWEVDAATGEEMEIWAYGDLVLTFNIAGELIGAGIYSDQYTGPRGIKVGMAAQEVLDKFPATNTGNSFIRYMAGMVTLYNEPLPPCAFLIRHDDSTFEFVCRAPIEPYGDDVKANPESYLYQDTAEMRVAISADGKVTGITWRKGPLSE